MQTIAALFGVQEAYATSRMTLAQRLPVELRPNSIRAVCQAAGDTVLQAEAALLNTSADWQRKPQPDAISRPPDRL